MSGPAPAAAACTRTVSVYHPVVAKLHFLGTGSVVSDPHRTTTMLALDNAQELLLIDCGGDAVPRLKASGLDPLRLRHLIVTHEHADHCAGFPLLMERLWVEGLRGEFHVHGLAPALSQVRRIHEAFNTADWPDFPEVIWHEVRPEPGSTVFEGGGWQITSASCVHPVPCIGLRATDRTSGAVLYYSADTERHDAQLDAAHGADLIVHEATGPFPGHASAAQAAELAAETGAARLALVHVPPAGPHRDADLSAAQALFPGAVIADESSTVGFRCVCGGALPDAPPQTHRNALVGVSTERQADRWGLLVEEGGRQEHRMKWPELPGVPA